MSRVKLPHVHSWRTRHGALVIYFRKPGCKTVRLRGIPGSPEFMRAYTTALIKGNQTETEITVKSWNARRAKAGTVAATVETMLCSAAFADLVEETQRTRRNILERFRIEHGDKRIAAIERRHVQAMVDAKAATPSAACNFLIAIKSLMQFAIEAGIRTDDPTIGVIAPDGKRWTSPLKLYVAHALDTTRFKVGVTRGEGETRRRDLQVGSPFKLEFVCMAEIESQEVETKAHDLLLRWHCQGEWFDLGQRANAFRRAVQRCQEAAEVLDVFDRATALRPADDTETVADTTEPAE